MNTKYRDKKKRFKLSPHLKAIVIGTLLGDANLNRRGKDYRILVKHGNSQRTLAEWKHKKFASITGMRINSFEQLVKDKMYGFCQFVTLTHPVFTDLHTIFYRKKTKIVPINIRGLLTKPLSLAVWIMDDGAKAGVGMTLQTHSFSERGVQRLRHTLKENFHLSTIIRKNKNKPVLYIPKSEIPKLKQMVKNYILPEYRYKIP